MDSDKFMQLISENSTLKYHINYEIYFFNHINQGLIALNFLGGFETDLLKFVNWYSKDLFQADSYRELENSSEFNGLNESEVSKKVKNIRGQRKYFYSLVSYFENLLKHKYNDDLDVLVANEYVKSQLYAGLVGWAFHSLIQLGYGLSINHPRMVCEGLAYAVIVYFGLNDDQSIDKIGCGQKDIFAVFEDLKADHVLNNYLRREYDKNQENILNKGRLVSFLEILYETRQDDLVKYAEDVGIQFPKENQESCLTSFFDSLLEITTSLFVRSETTCDFYFLHGITSTWSLKQVILKVHKLISLKDVHNMMKVLICGIVGVYLARKTPSIKPLSEVKNNLKIEDRHWNDIIKDTLTGQRDEHVYKLVMTCWTNDLSKGKDGANSAELNSNINVNKMASEIALKYDLYHQ